MADRAFLPNKAQARKFIFVLGIVGLVMAGIEVLYPRSTPPSGKWSWLTGPLYEAFGSYGIAGFYAVVALFLLATALWKKD